MTITEILLGPAPALTVLCVASLVIFGAFCYAVVRGLSS